MPVHDWTRLEADIFHSFHLGWVASLQQALNDGVLPPDCYALIEHQAGRPLRDLMTVPLVQAELPPSLGGILVTDVPPRVRRKLTLVSPGMHRRSLAIRHVSGHRLVALVEIVSPANKDRPRHLQEFVNKITDALRAGIHVLVVDLFPPGGADPTGIHGAIDADWHGTDEPYDLPADAPLTLASYASDTTIDVYLEHLAVGDALPDMPLFVEPDRYVNVPLEATYQATYRGTPAFWREVLERPALQAL